METLRWSGTFGNDQQQVEDIITEVNAYVGQVKEKFELAKTYWVDDNDAKGKTFKQEAVDMFNKIDTDLKDLSTAKDTLFNELASAMKNING